MVPSKFLDKDLKLICWPNKQGDKDLVVGYLASKFNPDYIYSEKEVNEVINRWHTFGDLPLLRRELVDRLWLGRDPSGLEYRVIKVTKKAD